MNAEQGQALGEAIAARIIGGNRALRILPYYLGGFFDQFFLGIVVSQFISYIPFIKTDKKHIVAFVFASVCCTLAATIDVALWLTEIFVWSYGSFMSFSKGSYIYRYIIIDIVSTFVVQAFYVDRAFRLHRHWWPLATLGAVVVTALGVGAGFIQVIYKKFQRLSPDVIDDPIVKTMAYTWLSLILLADLSITIVMVCGLYRNKTGWKHTDSHLKGLAVKCFEAQIPALIIAIITLVSWNQKLEIAIFFVMQHTKVYCIGLLVTLNFRVRPGANSVAQSYNSGATSGSYGLSELSSKQHNNVVIVDQETEVSIDQRQPWDMSKRSRVMDAEQASATSTHETTDHGHYRHPFAQPYQGEWSSTAELHEPLPVHRRGVGRG